ncbi:general transcription factor 3C polypeptide 6-like isoform X1 [Mytilus trossulus]|uniref:general transcription factor 3C polypeptide 6-like isoform X1 n=2 Tax=Mytilus trossulus TaxID=6551 RepID=UPI00300565CE
MSNKNVPDINDEEEMTFIVELSGILDSDLLSKVKGNCQVLGIDTDKPLLQLEQYTFTGEYEDTLGTGLVFEERDKSEASQLKETRQNILHHLLGEDSINTAVDLEFSHAVNKKLIMKRAFLTPEDETDGEPSTSDTVENVDMTAEDESSRTSTGPDG